MARPTFAANSNSSRRRFSKKWLVPGVLILAIGIVAVLELTDTTHLFHTAPSKVIVKAGKSTPAPKNNSSANEKPSTKTPSNNSTSRNIGGASDTQGSANATTSSNQWVVSRSGLITVKQPIANATIRSGSILSGSAKVGVVNFRLIDNAVGVISQGTLNVVNGNFSGTLSFAPHSSSGRLYVFSTDDKGVEFNEVQISVSF